MRQLFTALTLYAVPCASEPVRAEKNYAADVEERLWAWVREKGGVVSEAVSAAPRGNMRSVRAVKDIPADEVIIQIPRRLQLLPEVRARKSKFLKQLSRLDLPLYNVDFAMDIVREVRLRAARRAATPTAAEGEFDRMWDWLEFHLKAVGDYMEFWDKADIEPFGSAVLADWKRSRKGFKISHEKVTSHVKAQCPSGSEPTCKDVEGFGEISTRDFLKAVHMIWSRRFDAGMIVPVASLLNHAPATHASATFYIEPSHFTVYSGRDIKAGEEITITYGNWHNNQLLIEHAFTLPPHLEPQSLFFVDSARLRQDVFPQLDISYDFPPRVELLTPYLYWDKGESWQAEQQLESLSPLVHLGGLEALENLVNFYAAAELTENAALLKPFVDQLAKNRALDSSSRVWWADEAEAETADASSTDSLGSTRKSHLTRVLMSRVLCLTIYREALMINRGKLEPSTAIISASQLATHLKELESKVGASAEDELHRSVGLVKKAIAKSEWTTLPEKALGIAQRFVQEMDEDTEQKTEL